MRVYPTIPPEYVLEFESEKEYDSFILQCRETGSFRLEAETIPRQAVFRAKIAGRSRSSKLRTTEVTKEEGAYRVGMIVSRVKEPAPRPAEPASPDTDASGQEIGTEDDNERRETLYEKLRRMSVQNRTILALKAGPEERRVLMQQNNSRVQEFLLRNPHLSENEIVLMARNPSTPTQTILTIAGRPSWMQLDAVRTAIVLNPRTPPRLAMNLVGNLSEQDLLRSFQAPGLSMVVKGFLRREILKRGIRLPKTIDEKE
jgi:hypothetical protein